MTASRVLHIVATGRLSGAEKVVSDICTNLSEDFQSIAVCAGEELKEYYDGKNIETYVIDISRLSINEIRKLKQLIKDKRIDIVHSHDVKASIAGYLAAKAFKVPVVSHIHVTYLWMKKLGPLKIIDQYFRNKYTKSLACSEMVRDFYLEHNKKALQGKIEYLDNAFNFNEFNKIEPKDKESFKQQLGIDKDAYIYGYLGRLLEVKGADLMIDSFYDIQNKVDNSILLIVGDGPEREKLEAKVKEYGIENKVIFAGYQKNVYDYMNAFDCFILPSIREGLPIAVLEAMAMRKPVLSTPVAGLKKLMKNEFNGLVLRERSRKDLSEAMIKINEDKELSKNIAENAYKHLDENYNINTYVRKVERLYKDVLSGER